MTQLETVLTSEMKAQIQSVKRRGGKIFLCIPADGGAGCTNCHGGGSLTLQTVVGGPFETPQSGRGEGHGNEDDSGPINIYEAERWYQVRVSGYRCPVCNGQSLAVGPIQRNAPRAADMMHKAQEMVLG